MAGGLHHHRTMMTRYHPNYFGKLGMRHFHYVKNKYHCPTITIDKLWTLIPEDIREKCLTNPNQKEAPVIDVLASGYSKVLGRGTLPKKPIIVKAKFFTKRAEMMIKSVGGACILTA